MRITFGTKTLKQLHLVINPLWNCSYQVLGGRGGGMNLQTSGEGISFPNIFHREIVRGRWMVIEVKISTGTKEL